MKCNGEVESSGGGKEAKGEVKSWSKCNRKCGLIGSRKGFIYIYIYILRVVRIKF